MIIYKLTNKVNGKIYVGQTVRTAEERFKQHKYCKTSLIGKAIHKYGAENFSIEVLAECKTREELDEMEIFFIAYFDCIVPKGYNLTKGGRYKLVETKDTSGRRYIMVTDENGNIKGYFPLKKKSLGKEWIAVYQDMISTIAKWNLPNEQYRVFLALLGKVDFENYLTVSQKELAQELDMKQPHISRAIKALCERNVIIEGPRAGLNKTYRFNPYIAHKGSNSKKTIKDFNSALERKILNSADVLDTELVGDSLIGGN